MAGLPLLPQSKPYNPAKHRHTWVFAWKKGSLIKQYDKRNPMPLPPPQPPQMPGQGMPMPGMMPPMQAPPPSGPPPKKSPPKKEEKHKGPMGRRGDKKKVNLPNTGINTNLPQ